MSEKRMFSKPLKVLIVEDNDVDRRVLEAMLTETDDCVSELVSTKNLEEALAQLDMQHFDAVILDLNLPETKGTESLQILTQKFPRTAIVINTGAYEEELGLATLSSGAQDFLVKGKYTAYVLNKALHYAVERKHLEVALRDMHQKLKSTQDQLIQAEKMKVVGGLASGVAHEVKNPLATILYGITFLADHVKADHPEYPVVLNNIREAASRANTIINDLLDFAALTRLEKKPTQITGLVERALSLLRYELEKKKISVITAWDPKFPDLEVDLNRLEQVVLNLILNAIFAMPNGGKIRITLMKTVFDDAFSEKPFMREKVFNNGESIGVLMIDDEGTGIRPEDMKNIFDPFFTSRRGKGGVGLGLSVSKNIVENHGGQLIVRNMEKGGVRAAIILRLTA